MSPTGDEIARAHVRAWELLVQSVPGAWVQREGGALGVVTGARLGGFNGVWGVARDVEPGALGRLLDEVRRAGVPHCMQLRPGWPLEADEIARERGLARVPGEPLMVLEDDRLVARALEVEGLTLRQLAPDEGGLHARVAAGGQVVREEAAYRAVISPEVLRAPEIRCYVGEVSGEPVSTALSVTTGECVGVFSVATLPDHRGRGCGSAVTALAIRDGLERGAGWAWLSASEVGSPVYRRMGFVTLERLDFWEPSRN